MSSPAFQAPPKPWESTGNGNAEAGPSHTTAFDVHDQASGNGNGNTAMTTDRAPELPDRPGDMVANGGKLSIRAAD